MTYGEILRGLRALSKRGMDFGLERTEELLNSLDSPDKKLKIIHIAGTNGKGSTAAYMTEILLAAGKSVGTFTTPEVYDFTDQFKVNGKPIKEDIFTEAFGKALSVCGNATEFEVETAGALYAFYLSGCEYAVIECGLGGRYDATNAVRNKEIALITSISLEHTKILGETLESICFHKSGIIKNCPAVVSALQPEEVKAYFKKLNAKFADREIKTADGGFFYGGKEYSLTMKGYAQPYNAALAIEAAKILKIDETSIYSGVKRANTCGRIEVIKCCGKQYILDGAHNPASFIPLKEYLNETGGSITFIFGCLSDKDIDGNLSELCGISEKLYAVTPESPRAMDKEIMLDKCKKYFKDVVYAGSVENALNALNAATGDTVAVCGSFTLLREAKQWIEKRL